jgi:ppGpp synthetase/RelA/SpoT-type nucleotidyltranferase
MKASREKQERWVESFGNRVAVASVSEKLRRRGLGWLTDEQLSEIVSDIAAEARFTNRLNIRNRNRRSA